MMSTKMSVRGRWAAVAGLGVAAALSLAACAPPGASTPTTAPTESGPDKATGTLKVGFLSPTSGNFAVAGQEMLDGWNLYWEENGNEVAGVTIETIAEDDAGNPETALTKAHKLVEQDGVDIIVGPLIASTASAVAQYTSGLGIPNLHPVAASNDMTQQNWNEFTVRTGSMAGTQSTYPGGVWAAEQGNKTAVTLCHDYSFGWESCAGFVQGFVDNGGEIVQQIWAPNTTTDWAGYASQVQAALASGVDMVFVATAGGAPGPGFLTSYLDAGGDLDPLLLNCCAADQGTLRAMGDRILGLKSVSYWAEGRDAPATQQFVEATIAKLGIVPGAYIAGGYMTASLVAKVIEEQGLLVGSDLVDAITSFTFPDSIFGEVTWDEFNNTIMPVYIREVEKGADGLLYNVPIAEFLAVDQWLGKGAPADVRAIQPYDQTHQGL
ncbi:MAG TPA: ABC transporter substrate-binding protein [Microbacteriaceae bacterium]|nr:ABC transporter substrate-binding protein [Microbacteriaceae bacterium]